MNVSRRIAVETIGSIYLGDFIHGFDYTGPRNGWDQPSPFSSAVYGIYGVQVHQSFEPSGRITPFITYGGTGWFDYRRVNERRFSYNTGETMVYPASRVHRVVPPVLPTGGAGVRVKLTRHVFLETGAQAHAQLYGLGVAAHASVMVPTGRGK